MEDAAKFREKAEDCRRLAQQMSLSEHRDALLEMARQWDELADRWQRQMAQRHVEPGGSAEDDLSS